MLHARREHGNFWEEALIGRPGHDLMWVPLASGVGSNHHDSRSQEFDKVPAGAGDGEQVHVVGDVAQDLEVVWCWKSRYISMPTRPMFLNMLLNCMYSGYEPKPSNLDMVSTSAQRNFF